MNGKRLPNTGTCKPLRVRGLRMEVEYTREFWEHAQALVEGPHQCAECKAWHTRKSRPFVTVRLVLMGDGTPVPARLRMLCTKCFPESRTVKMSLKYIKSKMLDLPFDGVARPSADAEDAVGVAEETRTHRGSR